MTDIASIFDRANSLLENSDHASRNNGKRISEQREQVAIKRRKDTSSMVNSSFTSAYVNSSPSGFGGYEHSSFDVSMTPLKFGSSYEFRSTHSPHPLESGRRFMGSFDGRSTFGKPGVNQRYGSPILMAVDRGIPEIDEGSEDFGDQRWEDEGILEAVEAAEQLNTDNSVRVAPPEETRSDDTETIRSDPKPDSFVPNKHGIALIPTSKLPDRHRQFFRFPCFNAVQSKVFQSAYETDENLVVSAPTGSGKTTIFELAFLRLRSTSPEGSRPLAIYIAPTKALCYERAQDWIAKLRTFDDLKCMEVTGDTGTSVGTIKAINNADLIVTTPEKWDSITRRGKTNAHLLNRLALVMIDEVHILRDSRGATLEVVVSRMKARGDHVRFVALSATVPNIDDIARWIGQPSAEPEPSGVYEGGGTDGPKQDIPAKDAITSMPKAKVFRFGEEFRPTKLTREVYGYQESNDWGFMSSLDQEVWPLMIKHCQQQPVLIFCPTRKSCQSTAETLAEAYDAARSRHKSLPWPAPRTNRLILKDSKLAELSGCGIAVHHAGLDLADRKEIERAFKEGQIFVLISTSTLAVGVNLPAHTVIIKGTKSWQGAGWEEYSDIDIQQMMGRAGRPQFDTSGTVVVMCERSKISKYRAMLQSSTTLESRLHENLTEHINSEIELRTIVSIKTAQEWLKNSFLYIRIQQNPRHYSFADTKDKPSEKSWEEWLDHYVEDALAQLQQTQLIEPDPEADDTEEVAYSSLLTTSFGKIMSHCCISFRTMCAIMNIEEHYGIQELLEVFASATEFSDIRIRAGEAAMLNKLRNSSDIRYKLQNPAKTAADKVFLYAQICLGNVSLEEYATKTENSSPAHILMAIFKAAPRIAKAIQQVLLEKQFGGASAAALELYRSIQGKAWENTSTVFRQLQDIGPKSIARLSMENIHTFDALVRCAPGEIEGWLNRGAGFGQKVLREALDLPRVRVKYAEEDRSTEPGQAPRVSLRIAVDLLGKPSKKSRSGHVVNYNISVLVILSDGKYVDWRRIEAKKLNENSNNLIVEATLTTPDQKIQVIAGPDEVAGCTAIVEYDPKIDASHFPPTVEPRQADNEEDDTSAEVKNTTMKAPIEELNDPGHIAKVTKSKTSISDQAARPAACGHSCADRKRCRHECCKGGLNPAKNVQAKEIEGEDRGQQQPKSKSDIKKSKKKTSNRISKPETGNSSDTDDLMDLRDNTTYHKVKLLTQDHGQEARPLSANDQIEESQVKNKKGKSRKLETQTSETPNGSSPRKVKNSSPGSPIRNAEDTIDIPRSPSVEIVEEAQQENLDGLNSSDRSLSPINYNLIGISSSPVSSNTSRVQHGTPGRQDGEFEIAADEAQPIHEITSGGGESDMEDEIRLGEVSDHDDEHSPRLARDWSPFFASNPSRPTAILRPNDPTQNDVDDRIYQHQDQNVDSQSEDTAMDAEYDEGTFPVSPRKNGRRRLCTVSDRHNGPYSASFDHNPLPGATPDLRPFSSSPKRIYQDYNANPTQTYDDDYEESLEEEQQLDHLEDRRSRHIIKNRIDRRRSLSVQGDESDDFEIIETRKKTPQCIVHEDRLPNDSYRQTQNRRQGHPTHYDDDYSGYSQDQAPHQQHIFGHRTIGQRPPNRRIQRERGQQYDDYSIQNKQYEDFDEYQEDEYQDEQDHYQDSNEDYFVDQHSNIHTDPVDTKNYAI